MKILVIGAGVIGATYSWFLHLAGNDLTHYVRKEKLDYYKTNSIKINCWDKRRLFKRTVRTVYEPKFVAAINPHQDYNYLIVALKTGQLEGILTLLEANIGKSTILFLQNLAFNELKLIENSFDVSQYLLGFPPIGGGRSNNVVQSVILNLPTIIGEADGKIRNRTNEVKRMFESANLKIKISDKIISFLKIHFLTIAALLAPYFLTGSYDGSITPFFIRRSILAMRELFEICRKENIEARKMKEARMFYYPIWLLIPFLYFVFRSRTVRRICEGDLIQGGEWISNMYYYIYNEAKRLNIEFPVYEGFKPFVDQYNVG